MLCLEHQGIRNRRAMVLELNDDVDLYRSGDLCLDEFTGKTTSIARALERSLTLLPAFNEACDTARSFVTSATQPLYSRQFDGCRHYSISLLGIHPEFRIPVHDHPSTVSLFHVIEGRVQATHYDIVDQSGQNAFIQLASCSGKVLENGDAVVTMPDIENLHSLQALDRNAVCLTLQLYTRQEREPRSWYFPLASGQRSNTALWYRIQDKEICNGI